MKAPRSLPLTVSLIPLLLVSLLLSFSTAVSFLVRLGKGSDAEPVDSKSVLAGIGALFIFICALAAFRMKKWGLHGLVAMVVFSVLMTVFVGMGMLSLAIFVALPVAVAFGMKDFEQMD